MARTYKDKKGYKKYADSDKPVHRHVAERKLGGKIFKGFVVHHKNEDKTDNRRSNLQVMKRSEHSSLHAKKKKKSSWW